MTLATPQTDVSVDVTHGSVERRLQPASADPTQGRGRSTTALTTTLSGLCDGLGRAWGMMVTAIRLALRSSAVSRPMMVYLCYPYGLAGPIDRDRLRAICRAVAERSAIPVAPDLFSAAWDSQPGAIPARHRLRLLEACDEILVCSDPEVDELMTAEIGLARDFGLRVRLATADDTEARERA